MQIFHVRKGFHLCSRTVSTFSISEDMFTRTRTLNKNKGRHIRKVNIGKKCLPNDITKTCLLKYIDNFTTKKPESFYKKKSDIFHISAQNIDCGYSL